MDVRIVGPYRIDRMLGRGGMGEVYRAYDTRKRDRVVALKLLADHLTADAVFRARFQREAEIVAMLREPHIIPIHDYGEIDGRLYLDMRLVDGDDLAAILLNGPLTPERAVAIVEQVAAALDAAAAEGLLHRDVKPSNVLVTRGPPEFAYLTDFGIARFAAAEVRTALTSSGTVLGTVEYMAPERFGTDAVDHRADVYSLACVLFECLTGQRPFPERTIPALIGAHVARMPPRVGQLRPGLPSAMDDVVARGLAKQPQDRQHSAGEFAADARRALSSVSDSTTVRSTRDLPTVGTTLPAQRGDAAHGGRKPSPPRRRRLQPWVIAIATVVTLLVVGLVAIRNVPTPDGGETPAQPSATGSEPAGPSATGPEMALLGNEDAVSSVAVTELDGDVVVVSGGFDDSVRAWDLDTGRSIGAPLLGHDADVLSVACPDVGGRPVVVSGSFDTTLRLWDLASQQPAGGPLPAADMVSAVAVAQVDGRPVAFSGSWDDVIRAWDLETGQRRGEPFAGHAGEVVALATTSLDGRPVVVSGSFDDTVRVWDAATGQQLGQPLTGLSGDVFAVTAAQVDGRPVAAAAGKDHAIAVWDLRSHQLLFRLAGHTEDVKALATSVADGQPLLISSGTDGTIRFWSLATGQPVGTPLMGHDARPVYGLTVSGDLLISAGGDRAVRVWDLPQRAGLR